jgi:tetraacyldisaccharide 4'-kinase
MLRMPPVLSPLFFLPGLAFEALIRLRGGLYAAEMLPQRRLSGPVISIGNITMGGAGKTPLVIHVAQILSNFGVIPAVLSRGYGRHFPHKSHILSPGQEISSPATNLGDEPALIRRRVPSAWLGISKDRFTIGSKMAQQQAGLAFILDDGFQHRQLRRNLDIVVIDRSQPLGSNRVFPRGTLREPLSALRRCQVVVINGHMSADACDSVGEEIRSLHREAKLFCCEQIIESTIPFSTWEKKEGLRTLEMKVNSAYVVTALGNPERFLRDVQRCGIEVRGSRFYSDHYKLQKGDWTACVQEARHARAEAILATEKDAVKISHPPDFPLLVAMQTTRLSDSKAFERILKDSVEEDS